MITLDFLPPDPGMVNLIRQGLRAHKAEHGARERLPGGTPGPAPAALAAPGETPQTARLGAVRRPLQLAAG